MNEPVTTFPKLNRAAIRKLVADLAETSGCVRVSHHARKAMKDDDLNYSQILVCLKKGNWSEEPHLTLKGGWHCTLTCMTAGESVTVAVEVFNDRVKVITCWLNKGG